jgi:hypothetical protein
MNVKIVYQDRWMVSYLFEGPGDKTVRPADPNTPAALERERILKLIVEHETHPQLLESARCGLKTIEERRRKLDSDKSTT